jgi:hypothetical protein
LRVGPYLLMALLLGCLITASSRAEEVSGAGRGGPAPAPAQPVAHESSADGHHEGPVGVGSMPEPASRSTPAGIPGAGSPIDARTGVESFVRRPDQAGVFRITPTRKSLASLPAAPLRTPSSAAGATGRNPVGIAAPSTASNPIHNPGGAFVRGLSPAPIIGRSGNEALGTRGKLPPSPPQTASPVTAGLSANHGATNGTAMNRSGSALAPLGGAAKPSSQINGTSMGRR